MKRSLRRLTCSALVLFCCIAGCTRQHKNVRRLFALDTFIEITVFTSRPRTVNRHIDTLFTRIREIDSRLSISRHGSEVDRFNVSADTILEVSPLLDTLIERSRYEWQRSDGAFDVTVASLKRAWGLYDADTPSIPAQRERMRALARVGMAHIERIGSCRYRIENRATVDFGGIAKGYVLEMAASFLRARRCSSFIVNAGGDVYVSGQKKAGQPWRVAVAHPRRSGAFLAIVETTDRAIVTSGDYERYFTRDGIRYSHIIDPRTGVPCMKNRSVTVVGEDPVAVDAAATAAFCMDAAAALTYLHGRSMAGMIVDSSGSMLVSPSFPSHTILAEE